MISMRAPAQGSAELPGRNSPARAIFEPVRVVIDGAAVAKGRPRMTRQGVAYTPAATRKYEAHGRLAAQHAMESRPPLQGLCAMAVHVILPIPTSWSKVKQRAAVGAGCAKRPDGDNYLKASLDICNGIVFRDDAQVFDMRAIKTYGDDPRMEITVTEAA